MAVLCLLEQNRDSVAGRCLLFRQILRVSIRWLNRHRSHRTRSLHDSCSTATLWRYVPSEHAPDSRQCNAPIPTSGIFLYQHVGCVEQSEAHRSRLMRFVPQHILRPSGQGWRVGFNQQMVVIVHQTISVAIPIVAINRILQQHQKMLAISIITIDVFPSVTSPSHMIQRPAKLNS